MTAPGQVSFTPATDLDLTALADLYTRTFADYAFPVHVSPDHLARVIRVEDLDLRRSPVLRVDGEPVGLAMVGLRGEQAYCRGFGVTPPYRRRGLAGLLSAEMTRQAWLAGAKTMTLGVLKTNTAAVKTYRRAGFQVWRDLHTVEWQRATATSSLPAPHFPNDAIQPIEPETVLADFAAWHPTPPIWYRDRPSLRAQPDFMGVALVEGGRIAAYALVAAFESGAVEIADMGAMRVEAGRALLAALQTRHDRLVLANEPVGTLALAACQAAGFGVTHERYEMILSQLVE